MGNYIIGVAMTFALGTQCGIENLRTDVLAIHNASKEVLAKAGDLKVPSWRFPEKLGASVDVDGLLKDLCYSSSHDKDCASHVLLLELAVDRLLLLFQGCLQLSDRSRSSAPPLTLQSSVKKFVKKFIQDAAELSSLKSQVSTETVSCRGDSSRLPPYAQQRDTPAQQRDTPAQDAIPVQARAQQSSVACQTVDTAFAMCAKCFDFQRCVVSASSSVVQLCRASGGRESALAATDWKSLADIGGLPLAKWENALYKDLASVQDQLTLTVKACQKLTADLSTRDECIGRMEADMGALAAQVSTLKACVEEVRAAGDAALARSQQDLEVRLRVVEEAKGRHEGRATVLAAELDGARLKEEQLRAQVTELEHKVAGLESELQRQGEQEMQTNLLYKGLEEKLVCVSAEAADWQRRGEEQNMEARKAVAHAQSLERRNKSVEAKQSALLARLEELSQECEHVRCEVAQHSSDAEGKRVELEKMEAKCSDLQSKCTVLQSTIADHESKDVQSAVEHQHLTSVVFALEEQVKELMRQVETEKEKCHLLMEYPYIKPAASKDAIGAMTPLESQRQVSANTIRILLLEEQNSELRQQQAASLKRETGPSHHQSTATSTKLWKTDLLSLAAKEKASRPLSAKHHRETQSAGAKTGRDMSGTVAEESCSRSQSATRLKGRLGHLVTAIAEAHGEPSVPPPARTLGWVGRQEKGRGHKDMEVLTCQTCDRVFNSSSQLGQHQQYCIGPR